MRSVSLALVSAAALMIAVPALAQEAPAPAAPAPAAAPATGEVTDAQLESFNAAMVKVRDVSRAVQGGTPTTEQQAAMAAAISASGLGIEQFNAISTQVSSDEVLQARLAVIAAPAPAAGSVAASVTDDEVAKFSATMVKMREIAPAAGTAPSAEQQAAMASTVQNSGLSVDRFNAIATAVSQDEKLRARVELADARRG
ncbi:hypothetical protein BH09PSE1_BH09PSE1_27450 [soil metagenome]